LNVYSKVSVKSSLLMCPNVCFEIRAFLTYLGAFSSNPSTFLSIQSHFPHPSQKSFEQNKEMTFGRRLANVTDPVVRGLYCPSTQHLIEKALHEITVNSQSFTLIFFLLSFDPQQYSNGTSLHYLTTRHWQQIFLGMRNAIF